MSGSGGLKQAQSQRLESRHEGAVGLSTYLTYLGAFQCAPYVAIMLALFLVRRWEDILGVMGLCLGSRLSSLY